MLSPPPPPVVPPPIFTGDRHYSYNPSILTIVAIVVAAVIAAASIKLLLRALSRSRSPPLIHRHLPSSSSSSSSSGSSSSFSRSAPSSPPSDEDPKAVIDSLPLFSLSSSTAKPSSSLDCAVCLSPFQHSDELRLLPSCRHAFHSQCIDTWLRSSLSCPLCRSPITPIPSPPPPPAAALDPTRSDSFRVEIGSVSRRSDDSSAAAVAPPHVTSFSLGSSFEYVVDEEIEAVLSRIRRRDPAVDKPELEQAPPPPGTELAEIAGASQRSWLKEYVDRLASSASSSFSSLRFSQRGSQRFDSTSITAAAATATGGESWDVERNMHLQSEEEGGGQSVLYRWLVGAQP